MIYSEATDSLRAFVDATGIPVGETQAGKGASPTRGIPESLNASNEATLMFTKATSGLWNAVLDAVVKSEYRVPMPITTSASCAMMFAPLVPVAEISKEWQWLCNSHLT